MSQSRRRKAGARNPRHATDDPEFWGDAGDGGVEIDAVRPAAEPNAMVNSLGPAPLPGRETIAEHYFAAIYERAAALAAAIAASSDLLADTDEPS
jgi:hypothetical protein